MTVFLPVDAGYAFDYLSILQVKAANRLISEDQAAAVVSTLADQLGKLKVMSILESTEFIELVEANERVFEYVDQAQLDRCKASEVCFANHRRYLCKKRLQSKFWPGSVLTEQKSGRV